MPALLTSTSSRPNSSRARRMKPMASASRSVCVSTKTALTPLPRISSATRRPRSTSRSAMAICAPSSAKSRAVASPMPEAPPVTAATFPPSRPIPNVLPRRRLHPFLAPTPPLERLPGPGAGWQRQHRDAVPAPLALAGWLASATSSSLPDGRASRHAADRPYLPSREVGRTSTLTLGPAWPTIVDRREKEATAMPVITRQIGPCFPADVEGLDLTRPLSPEDVAAIHAGMDRYAVLVLHDQPIDDEQQLAFTRR